MILDKISMKEDFFGHSTDEGFTFGIKGCNSEDLDFQAIKEAEQKINHANDNSDIYDNIVFLRDLIKKKSYLIEKYYKLFYLISITNLEHADCLIRKVSKGFFKTLIEANSSKLVCSTKEISFFINKMAHSANKESLENAVWIFKTVSYFDVFEYPFHIISLIPTLIKRFECNRYIDILKSIKRIIRRSICYLEYKSYSIFQRSFFDDLLSKMIHSIDVTSFICLHSNYIVMFVKIVTIIGMSYRKCSCGSVFQGFYDCFPYNNLPLIDNFLISSYLVRVIKEHSRIDQFVRSNSNTNEYSFLLLKNPELYSVYPFMDEINLNMAVDFMIENKYINKKLIINIKETKKTDGFDLKAMILVATFLPIMPDTMESFLQMLGSIPQIQPKSYENLCSILSDEKKFDENTCSKIISAISPNSKDIPTLIDFLLKLGNARPNIRHILGNHMTIIQQMNRNCYTFDFNRIDLVHWRLMESLSK